MKLRKYLPSDCTALAELFFHTVHTINAKDYTESQLDVWASGKTDISAWNKSFLEHDTIITETDRIITGFGDMACDGFLDRLYVHKDFQNKGIASAILKELERHAMLNGVVRFATHASITARPFFENRGYQVVRKNIVIRCGIELTNYIMTKYII